MSFTQNAIRSINSAIKTAVTKIQDIGDFYEWQRSIIKSFGNLETVTKQTKNGTFYKQIRNTKENRKRSSTVKKVREKINPKTLNRKIKNMNKQRKKKDEINQMIESLYERWKENRLEDEYNEIAEYFDLGNNETGGQIPKNIAESALEKYYSEDSYLNEFDLTKGEEIEL